LRGKIAAYLVTAILVMAVMSAYAGYTFAPTRTLIQTTTTTITNAATSTTTITSSGVPNTRIVTAYYCGAESELMSINGSTYCTYDVSRDTVVGNPGYSYFVNGPVNFMGVQFTTYCPPNYAGCPVPANYTTTTTTTMLIGAMRFNMTFPDKAVEVAGDVIGDSHYVLMLSNHANPKAGMLIQYISNNGYTGYSVLLLDRYP
jgi:hypothetical protein